MDGLMLMLPVSRATGYRGPGDFCLQSSGRLAPPGSDGQPTLVYAGAQIIKTEGLAEIEDEVFSVSRLWSRMIERDRLYGIVHAGRWAEVGHPEAVEIAETMLNERASEEVEAVIESAGRPGSLPCRSAATSRNRSSPASCRGSDRVRRKNWRGLSSMPVLPTEDGS